MPRFVSFLYTSLFVFVWLTVCYIRAVKQACAVYLKNRINRSWNADPIKPYPNQIPISSTDKMSIKQNILQILVNSTTSSIRVQIASLIGTIVSSDVPDQWPQFLEIVLQLLISNNFNEKFAGQLALHEIMKAWRLVCRY